MMAHMYAKGADIATKDASEKIVIGGQEEVNMQGWIGHPDYLPVAIYISVSIYGIQTGHVIREVFCLCLLPKSTTDMVSIW